VEDSNKVTETFDTLNYVLPPNGLTVLKRIGRIGDRPRPILLQFSDEYKSKRSELLQLAKNLKDCPERKNYYIKPDLTINQQKKERIVYEELKKVRLENPGNRYFIKAGKVTQKTSTTD
jgi:hypothetical protein